MKIGDVAYISLHSGLFKPTIRNIESFKILSEKENQFGIKMPLLPLIVFYPKENFFLTKKDCLNAAIKKYNKQMDKYDLLDFEELFEEDL